MITITISASSFAVGALVGFIGCWISILFAIFGPHFDDKG